MPYSLKIETKIVELNDKNKALLDLLDAVLAQEGLGEGSGLSPGANRDKPGWWARLITTPLEKVTQQALGAQTRELPLLILSIDPPAKILREGYIDFLNSLVQGEKINSSKTESIKIESGFVLIRELFIRLASVALCTDMSAERDGDKILKVLKAFAEKINAIDLLKNKDYKGNPTLSDFNKHFSTTHHAWVECLQDMVDILKNLRTNIMAISDVLDYLSNVKLTIMRQLVANLDPKQSTDNLAENWLRNTLYACERKILGGKAEISNLHNLSTTYMASWEAMAMTSEQKDIVSKFNQSQVKDLYSLLNNTNLLLQVMHHLDQLFTISGWIPIMLGAIKIGQLVQKIKAHGENCCVLLSLTANNKLLNESVSNGLVKYNATSGGGLKNLALKVSKGLSSLQNPRLHQLLASCISHSLSQLAQLQTSLDCQIVDPNYCKSLVLVQADLALPNEKLASENKEGGLHEGNKLKQALSSSEYSFFNSKSGGSTDFFRDYFALIETEFNEAVALTEQEKYSEAAVKLEFIINFGNKFIPLYKDALFSHAMLLLQSKDNDTALKAYTNLSKLQIFVNNTNAKILLQEIETRFKQKEMKISFS